MIPARIISISDKVMVEYWNPPSFREKLIIAEVENVFKSSIFNDWRITTYCGEVDGEEKLSLNQSCFIEPTSEGKCEIIKI